MQDINESCPADLEPYLSAKKLELQERDTMIYAICGNYVMSAVYTAVEHNLAGLFGKKGKSKYTEEKIAQVVERNRPLTEEEKQKKRDAFVANMLAMKANFDANRESDNAS